LLLSLFAFLLPFVSRLFLSAFLMREKKKRTRRSRLLEACFLSKSLFVSKTLLYS